MQIVITNSEQETEALGARFAERLPGGTVVAMYGDLGAGKTAFVRGMARGMGLNCRVSSPTFTIVNEYLGERELIHFDMYRIADENELETTGFYDYPQQESVFAVEWSENIEAALPKDTMFLTLQRTGDEERRITLKGDERFADIGT